MSFGLFLLGYLIVVGGLTYGAALLHVPTHWIIVGAIVAVGAGILTSVKTTRRRDPTS